MNILIIGSGGREHAIAWKVAQSPRLSKLYIEPGNAGTASVGENVDLTIADHPAVIRFCKETKIDLVIVGPEGPLADGLADSLSGAGIRCFGPSQAAAQIEASKSFSKQFMARHGIPTARYQIFTDIKSALEYIETIDYPNVIKASGLAAGKGVILPETLSEAKSTLEQIFVEGVFGEAGNEVIIEERLSGQEVSLMAFTDGATVIPMLPAQDHKRLLDGDHGPNTGGMGAYAPAPIFTADLMNEAVEFILKPAVDGLRSEGIPFVGVLYAGLILTQYGIRTIEFNCRFGDPETQAVLPLLQTDLVDVVDACVDGTLDKTVIRWKSGSAACVVLASEGYPNKSAVGKLVEIDTLLENSICFHAGTKLENGQVISSGGRVFGVTAWAETLADSIASAYDAVGRVRFDGVQYRKDIGQRALSSTDFESDKRIETDSSTDRFANRTNGIKPIEV